jgi:hypothetical protein
MMELLDPTVERAPRPITWAPRPASLEGLRIALVENTKFNSDRLLQKIGDLLVREYGAAGARLFRKRNASVPVHPELLEEIRRTADVMVAGIGD